MSLPVAIICLFIGSTLIWVGSHGTNATSPWDLYQQVISGLSGDSSADTESTTTDDAGPNTDDTDTSSSSSRLGTQGGQ